MSKINIIIADSSPLSRAGLRSIFSSTNYSIVAEAQDSDELKEQINNFKTDVLIIDYEGESLSIDIVAEIIQDKKLAVVGIIQNHTANTLKEALRIGIKGHIKKSCSIPEIQDAVNETYQGKSFFCGELLELLQNEDINPNDNLNFDCSPISISEREIEIISHIAEGYTNSQIAEKLFLSNHTINTHRKNIIQKLGVKNTAGIVLYAVKSGLISPNKYLFAPDS